MVQAFGTIRLGVRLSHLGPSEYLSRFSNFLLLICKFSHVVTRKCITFFACEPVCERTLFLISYRRAIPKTHCWYSRGTGATDICAAFCGARRPSTVWPQAALPHLLYWLWQLFGELRSLFRWLLHNELWNLGNIGGWWKRTLLCPGYLDPAVPHSPDWPDHSTQNHGSVFMVIKGQQQQEFLVDNFHKIRYDGKNSPTILFEKESTRHTSITWYQRALYTLNPA